MHFTLFCSICKNIFLLVQKIKISVIIVVINMMVNTCKMYLCNVLSCLVLLTVFLMLTGCTNNSHVINTNAMPGHKFTNVMKNTTGQAQKGASPIVKTKSGVYIYKDNSTVNTTGYRFHINDSMDIGPSDIRFDAEHFRTRY